MPKNHEIRFRTSKEYKQNVLRLIDILFPEMKRTFVFSFIFDVGLKQIITLNQKEVFEALRNYKK